MRGFPAGLFLFHAISALTAAVVLSSRGSKPQQRAHFLTPYVLSMMKRLLCPDKTFSGYENVLQLKNCHPEFLQAG